ncbi:MAG: c-type cytochrome [Candidatus Rokubacteria bacterium]|nr:c-type cytochrome [Candidatus Rokubacteria bacterium]
MTALAGALAFLTLLLVTAPAAADGDVVYRARCAVCHGTEGRGDGPAAGLLAPRPRDFTTGHYKFRSTPTGSLPTLADVVTTTARGLRGTSMPGFGDLLAPGEIEAVARHVLALAPPAAHRAAPLPLPAVARGDGAALFTRAGCGECHGADGRGSAWRTSGAPPWGGRPATRLDEPWTFRAGSDEVSVAQRILTGLDGSAMPAYADALSGAEARALARYVRSLARPPIWEERDPARVATAGLATDPRERGRYLVHAMQCPLCHTPISAETGAYDTQYFLAGGMRVSAWPWGVWYSRNLTPDVATGLGGWSEDAIVAAVTRGVRPDGGRLDPMAMPWPWFSRLSPGDARAIVAYLRSLPPMPNAVPPPETISFGERVGGKLAALAGAEAAVAFWGGNAARTHDLPDVVPLGRRRAARALGWGTLILALGAGAFALRRPGVRWRRRFVLPCAVVAIAAWGVLGGWPPLALLSPEQTTRWLFLGTPELPASLTGAPRALVERGEYLSTVAPCGLCHTPADAFAGFLTGRTLAGGMEARWRVYGRTVSSNLTAHPDGIGAADDAGLLRAMTSGVGRDGRALHWQAMPWDLTSNWSEEDRRAMLRYLRALPPVPGRMPSSRPPRTDDPAADTFSFGDVAIR